MQQYRGTLEELNSMFLYHFHIYSWMKVLTTNEMDHLLASYQLK